MKVLYQRAARTCERLSHEQNRGDVHTIVSSTNGDNSTGMVWALYENGHGETEVEVNETSCNS